MTHTRMFQGYPVSLVKLSFFFIQVKIIQVLDFDNWHPLKRFIDCIVVYLEYSNPYFQTMDIQVRSVINIPLRYSEIN